jgi:type IV secretory pathway TrbD component
MIGLIVLAAASVLAFAATAKLLSLVPSLSLIGRSGLAALSVAEFGLAVWLVSAYRAGLSRRVAASVFAVFCGVALWRWWAGYASCGCFGTAVVPPLLTAVLDVSLATALLLAAQQSNAAPISLQRRRWLAPSLGLGVLLVSIAAAIFWTLPSRSGPPYVAFGRLVFDPAQWTGHPLPMVDRVNWPTDISKGRVKLVLFSTRCADCWKRLPEYVTQSRAATTTASPSPILVLATGHPTDLGEHTGALLIAERTDPMEWATLTPREIDLADGRVVAVRP